MSARPKLRQSDSSINAWFQHGSSSPARGMRGGDYKLSLAKLNDQLLRSALIGLTREALRAGKYPENRATARSAKTIPRNVRKSQGEVEKSSDAIRRAAAKDAAVPKMMPAIVRRSVLASTSRMTRPVVAPSAMRTPIS